MIRWNRLIATVAASLLLAGVVVPIPLAGPYPNPIPFMDSTSMIQSAAAQEKDRTKREVIEKPVANLVAKDTAKANPDNPTVEPGKVKWHKSFDAACLAAEKSGKPVLLFHMMGKLDEQFC